MKLGNAITEKSKGSVKRRVMLQHIDATAHTFNIWKNTIREQSMIEISHSPYSPYISFCYKKFNQGNRYTNNDVKTNEVVDSFRVSVQPLLEI